MVRICRLTRKVREGDQMEKGRLRATESERKGQPRGFGGGTQSRVVYLRNKLIKMGGNKLRQHTHLRKKRSKKRGAYFEKILIMGRLVFLETPAGGLSNRQGPNPI